MINQFESIAKKLSQSVSSINERTISFHLYIMLLKQISSFVDHFSKNFSNNFFNNIKNELSILLNVLQGNTNLLISKQNCLKNGVLKLHPCLEVIKLKFMTNKLKILKFMREPLKYSFTNQNLSESNNVLFFLLFCNNAFKKNFLSDEKQRDWNYFDLDIFSSKSI